MASPSCGFPTLLQGAGSCGLSSDYPDQTEIVSLQDCTRDVSRHRELCGLSADTELDSEYKLLLARAGKSTHMKLTATFALRRIALRLHPVKSPKNYATSVRILPFVPKLGLFSQMYHQKKVGRYLSFYG